MNTVYFDLPEFYPQDRIVMRVDGSNDTYLIISEGERCVEFEDAAGNQHVIHGSQSFRNNFPDGNIPEDSDTFRWINNGWFAVYKEGCIEVIGEPMDSLVDAMTYALSLTYGGSNEC